MSPDFKFNLDTIQDSDLAANGVLGKNSSKEDNNYYQSGSIRNLCFKWPDGKQFFLNYSYLVAAEYLPEAGTILLEFTTHSVLLRGFMLDMLYKDIMQQFTQYVICQDERYNDIEKHTKPIVNEIVAMKSIK